MNALVRGDLDPDHDVQVTHPVAAPIRVNRSGMRACSGVKTGGSTTPASPRELSLFLPTLNAAQKALVIYLRTQLRLSLDDLRAGHAEFFCSSPLYMRRTVLHAGSAKEEKTGCLWRPWCFICSSWA